MTPTMHTLAAGTKNVLHLRVEPSIYNEGEKMETQKAHMTTLAPDLPIYEHTGVRLIVNNSQTHNSEMDALSYF
jgi:hypothetical protein